MKYRWAMVAIVALAAGLAGICLMVRCGAIPVNADVPPSQSETWVATTVLDASIEHDAAGLRNPLEADAQTERAGLQLYAHYCMACHGSSSGKPSAIATGLYQRPPQFAQGCTTDDPESQTYWKIAHGIRFTGMPAFAQSLGAQQIWELTTFLKHLDSLAPSVKKQWEHL